MSKDKIDTVPVDELYLDPENPRLPTSVIRDQPSMLRYIARNTSITELMAAIAENDYFPGEPLVVVPRQDEAGYWVVEGNRRLTALKLLRDPSIYPNNRRVQEISDEAQFRPDLVPCVVFDNRSSVVNYLGYRHISGIKQWEPLAKARYIAQYFETLTDPNLGPEARYKEVARGIGSQGPYIKRQLDAFAVYRKIEDEGFYGIDGLDEESISFSLLSTALGYESILNFVSANPHPFVNPNAVRADAVINLAHWMYAKNNKGETPLGDSRNIQRLAVVVDDPDALSQFIEDKNLQKAFAATMGVSVEFYELLVELESLISRAAATIALVDLNEGHRARISDIAKQARLLQRTAEDY